MRGTQFLVEALWSATPSSPQSPTPESTDVDGALFPDEESQLFYCLTRPAEGEAAVTEYVIKVDVGSSSWLVPHRYREFDSLRLVLLAQDPFNAAFKEFCDTRFPGKLLLALSARNLQQRVEVTLT
jgi:hypothetical protein